jgi:hypothetical protein
MSFRLAAGHKPGFGDGDGGTQAKGEQAPFLPQSLGWRVFRGLGRINRGWGEETGGLQPQRFSRNPDAIDREPQVARMGPWLGWNRGRVNALDLAMDRFADWDQGLAVNGKWGGDERRKRIASMESGYRQPILQPNRKQRTRGQGAGTRGWTKRLAHGGIQPTG